MKEKVTKIKCDFCNTEIEKSTPHVREMAELHEKQVEVEIKIYNTSKKRFTSDICRDCVFEAVSSVAPPAVETEPGKGF